MTTDQRTAADSPSGSPEGKAEQSPPRPSGQDDAHLIAELQAARAAEARQVGAAARLRARLFDLTERMLSLTGSQPAGTEGDESADHMAAAMADLKAELQELTAQLDQQRSAGNQAQALLAARDAELQRVTAEAQAAGGRLSAKVLTAGDKAMAQMADKLQEMTLACEAAKALAGQRQTEIQTLTDMHERRLTELEAARSAAATAREQAETLQTETGTRQTKIRTLTAERDELLARIAAQDQRLDARETALARMADDLQAAGRARDEAKAVADQSRNEVRTLTALLERRLTELETARANTAQARELAEARQGEIDALLASTSWRITRPMRAFKSGLRSLRGR